MDVGMSSKAMLSLARTVIALGTLCSVDSFAQAVGKYTIEDVAFLAGCWEGSPADGTVIRETYTTPRANLMLGNSQTVIGGKTRFFEFIQLMQTQDGVVYRPLPNGKSAAAFTLVKALGTEAVFENATNDFPQRITYVYDAATGVLTARIETLDGSKTESFPMKATGCGGETHRKALR
jgi:hypothetical protein